jgi:hypothetical protein
MLWQHVNLCTDHGAGRYLLLGSYTRYNINCIHMRSYLINLTGSAIATSIVRMYGKENIAVFIRRAQVKVGLINLCKGLFSLNARIYYKLKSGT